MNDRILYVEDFANDLRKARSSHIKVRCPFCDETRSNKTDRSLSIDVKTLAYKCHYCEASGVLKSRFNEIIDKSSAQMYKAKKTYKRPQPVPEEHFTLPKELVEYFNGRGISEATLLKCKVSKETHFFPQLNKKQGCIGFNYYLDGERINTKFRTRNKDFTLIGGAELIPYNIDSIRPESYKDGEEKHCIVTEGECFPLGTQILTMSGWVNFEDLSKEDCVAQFNNGIISFVQPKAIIIKDYDDNLVKYANARNNYFSMTTKNHNLVVERDGRVFKMKADDIRSQIRVMRSGFFNGQGIEMSDDEIRLYCAISADFTIRKEGDLYACFKKERKIKRIKMLLDNLNLRYSMKPCRSREDYTSVYIHRNQNIKCGKLFDFGWIGSLSSHQIQVFLEEVIQWDGNSVKGRTMKEYSSKYYENCLFVQTLCHLNGMCSTINKRQNKFGTWYKVSILQKKYSRISSKLKSYVKYTGKVYCVTVDSGAILVRQNGLITVSGNCDALTYVECGFEHVISVPNGANRNLEYLDDFIETHFDHLTDIYISSDNDKKGLELRHELVRRFGNDRCRIVDYPKPCKDINEVLVQYGKDAVKQCVANAVETKPEGVQDLWDVEMAVDEIYRHGFQKGYTIGVEDFDKIFSVKTGLLGVVTGLPSHGKALSINELLPTPHGWKTMGEVEVGDELYDKDGNICRVTYVTPVMYGHECYKMTFSDGSEVICDKDHLWVTRLSKGRAKAIAPQKERTTKEILDTLYAENGKRSNHAIEVQKAIEGICVNASIHPYVLGYWLGNGSSHRGIITTADKDVVNEFEKLGYETSKHKSKYNYGVKGLKGLLRAENLLGYKRIPAKYLRAPIEQRIELLKGLMDSDGTCEKDGACNYSSSRKELADDVYELVVSLGMKATITSKQAKLYGVNKKVNYRVHFHPWFNCFKLKRKSCRLKEKYSDRVNWRYITKIEEVESVPVKCITVDSPTHTYLCTKSMIPTHNTFFLNYILIRLNILHDWKTAFFSPEFYPVGDHVAQILETFGGKRFNNANYNEMTYEKMKEYLSKNMFWIDPNDTDINSVLDRAKYLIRKKGIKALVIDPFNALTDKERKITKQDEYISDFLQNLRWFARKYDVAVFLVMHPTKQKRLENGLYPVCDLYDCKGASEIFDKADFGITVWRNEAENYCEAHVTKMKFRHLGDKGHATFKFDVTNGRYVPIKDADTEKSLGASLANYVPAWDKRNYILDKINGSIQQAEMTMSEPPSQQIPHNTSFDTPTQEPFADFSDNEFDNNDYGLPY